MTDLLAILVGIVLINDLVLARFVGRCLLLQPGADLQATAATSLVMSLVLALTALVCWGSSEWLLTPLGHPELDLLLATLIAVVASPLVTSAACALDPALRPALAPCPAAVTVNCVLLAAVLVSTGRFSAPGAALGWALGSGLGFGLAMSLYGELRRRLAAGDVPQPFRGAAIALLTGGILSLALRGLAGILRD